MSILTVSNVAKSFGADTLFSDITFSLAAGQKLGLIGRNGGGKTTLLRILLGQDRPDPSSNPPAKVSLASGRRMGYLRQEAPVHPENTLGQEIEEALAPIRAIQAELAAAEHAMSVATTDDALEKALTDYTLAHDAFEARGGYAIEEQRDSVLRRLGFSPEILDKTVGSCSGGEQTRLALAKLVLTRPDLLILDEPTNHLDINAVEWLEGFLKDYAGAVMVVSHDRYFLDAVTDTTAELEFQKLTLYKGNYSHYRRQKEEKLQRQQELYEIQQKEIGRLNDLIKRNMGADANASNIRHKTQGRIERMEKVEAVRTDTTRVRAKIDTSGAGRIGREVVRLSGLAKAYGDRTLFSGLEAVVERDDRVGIVGPNGAGKTTLVKLLLGEEQPTAGTITFGHNVRRAYFSQHATDALDESLTVLETLKEKAKTYTETQARSYLARFLFFGDDVHKTVKMLSGGEKSKLALACLLLEPCNLLILDEPTNHLDIESCETLSAMLEQFDGTLLLISHDRYLLNAVTNKTLGLLGNGKALFVEGNYAAWREAQASPLPPSGSLLVPRNEGGNRREQSKARAKLQAAVDKAEAQVQTLEAQLATLESTLSSGQGDVVATAAEYTKVQEQLHAALAEWERLSEELG